MDIYGVSILLVLVIPFIVQQLKKLSFISPKIVPIIPFLLGMIFAVLALVFRQAPPDMSFVQAMLVGLAIGGTSIGLYDVVKIITEPVK